jgi:hypothetical protein
MEALSSRNAAASYHVHMTNPSSNNALPPGFGPGGTRVRYARQERDNAVATVE